MTEPTSTRFRPGGCLDVLVISLPLMLSAAGWALQHFIDRMFITWHSEEAVAAALPAGLTSFALATVFMGTAGYVSTFVAQYAGAERPERIGPALWQGLYIALLAGLCHLALYPLAGRIFAAIGHPAAVQAQEVPYFRMLCLGTGAGVAGAAMAGFYTGRGKTWVVMVVSISGVAFNLVADYGLIFGKLGLPEMGIAGAGLATAGAAWLQFVLYAILMLRPSLDRRFGTLRGWRLDRELMGRLLRFGGPTGIQFFIDIAGFTVFVLLMGRLGQSAMAASNIAFNINSLAFMPMIGFGMGVSALVGRYLGADRAEDAERSAWSALWMAVAYMGLLSLLYVAVPWLLLMPYEAGADAEQFATVRQTVIVLLRFVALYSIVDAVNIIFSNVLRGAGDTRFVMGMIVCLSLTALVLPTYVLIVHLQMGLYAAWIILTAYIFLLALAFLLRFLTGKWKSMRVIEEAPIIPPTLPEDPAGEV